MNERRTELELALSKKQDKKVTKILKAAVVERDATIVDILKQTIENERDDGIIINVATKAYFRLSRKHLNDCGALFELWDIDDFTVQESLLEVLGYDKVIPSIEEQRKIINKYFHFGDNTDYRYFSDPRYGLAAACAGWDPIVVEPFLKNCLTVPDASLKYVAENSLKNKYVKLR